MIRSFLLVALIPFAAMAQVSTTASPINIQSNEYISIDNGENFITDLGFKEQRSLVDEILGAVGDLSLSSTLIRNEFEVDGHPASAAIKARVNLNRRIYSTNLGEVDRNGQPLSPLRSVYTVVDEVKNELRFETRIDTSSIISIEPLNVHAAVAVKRIYEVGSLADYHARRDTKSSLAEIGVAADDETDTTSSYIKKSASVLTAFNRVINAAEEIFRRGSDFFADKEKTKIFLENVFDPLRLDTEFFRLTAEKLRDSSSVRVGEILTHSVSVRILPAGVKLEKGVAEAEFYPKAYTIIIHSAFKKVSPTEVVAKSILEVRKGREFKASIELMNTGYEPIRWNVTRFNYEMNEYAYKFDLSNPAHVNAFNGIFAKRWFSRDITKLPSTVGDIGSIQNPEYLIFTKDKSTPITNIEKRFRSELLVASYKSSTFRLLEKVVSKPVEENEVTEYTGLTGKITSSKVRIGFKGMKEDEQTTRQLKSYVRVEESQNPKAELAFEYVFNDRFTNKNENDHYVSFLKMAIASQDLVGNSVAMQNIVKALNERQSSKRDQDDSQYLALRLSISTEVTNAIFNNPANAENIKLLIGRLLLGDKYKKWEDIANPKAPNLRFPNECRELVVDANELVYSRSAKVSCFALRGLVHTLYNSFIEIMNAKDSAERLSILNSFFKDRYFKAFVPLLILQLATIQNHQDGGVSYKSIDPLLANGDLGIEVVLDGNGLEFPVRLNYDKTNILQRVQLADDFNFISVNDGERRLQNKGAYIKASERGLANPPVYVRINSNVDFSSGQRAIVTLKEYRFGRADKEISTIEVNELRPVLQEARQFSTSKTFSYVITIPNNNEISLRKKNDYVASIQIIDSEGNFITEVVEVKFTIK